MNKKILIVEDSKSYIFILSQTFEKENFVVVTAENGEDGLVAAKNSKPDLILLDITMPKMDGITMAKNLKEMGIKAPIIFLTNMGDMKHISDAMETTNDVDYIIKAEVSVEDIVDRVKKRLGM